MGDTFGDTGISKTGARILKAMGHLTLPEEAIPEYEKTIDLHTGDNYLRHIEKENK